MTGHLAHYWPFALQMVYFISRDHIAFFTQGTSIILQIRICDVHLKNTEVVTLDHVLKEKSCEPTWENAHSEALHTS